jgi:hypothetical protein
VQEQLLLQEEQMVMIQYLVQVLHLHLQQVVVEVEEEILTLP